MAGSGAVEDPLDLYRRITENAQEIIAEFDARGRCAYVSPSVERVLGVTQQGFVADPWALMHESEREATAKAMAWRVAAGGQGELRFRLRHVSGRWLWFDNRSNVVTTASGDVRVVTVSRDVTEQLEIESQLQQSRKLDALGQLAGGIAHDFNNLLTVIMACSETLVEGLGADAPLRQDAEMISHAAEKAAKLTGQLLSFGRRTIRQPDVLSLGQVVHSMRSLLERVIGEDIELCVESGPDTPLVLADRGQLEQVVLNLAVNARDAMPRGGRLSIEVERAVGEGVELRVTDTGGGMTEAVRARIFEPYFTTKGLGEGSGLGLATVYGIVEQAGGRISVRSEPGRGSRFSVFLPRAESQGGLLPAPDSARPAAPSRGTILLVEDEPAVRLLARRQLQESGYRVVEAESAESALDLASRLDYEIDLLITDVVMAGIKGPELAEQLRAHAPALRVLFISGYPGAGGDREATPLLAKPFTGTLLAQRARDVLA